MNCQYYVLRTLIDLMKENRFTIKKKKRQEADYSPHKQLWTQTSQMTLRFWHIHQLRLNYNCIFWRWQHIALASVGMQIKGSKSILIIKETSPRSGDISTLTGGSLKIEDKFSCLRSSIPTTENDINMRVSKAATSIDRISSKWKSGYPIKYNAIFSK